MGLFSGCLQFVSCFFEEALLFHNHVVLQKSRYLVVQVPQWLNRKGGEEEGGGRRGGREGGTAEQRGGEREGERGEGEEDERRG